jgi:4-hydroxyphenylpyruvate dioxygenase
MWNIILIIVVNATIIHIMIKSNQEQKVDFLPLLGTDYVEIYVSNARQAAYFYKTAFGFQSLAFAGLETGMKDRESYVVVQDKIRIVLTSSLQSESLIGDHVQKHGDGVKTVAFWVDDATEAYHKTIEKGAVS